MLELHRFLSEILRANITAIVWFIKFIGKRYRYIDICIIRGAEVKGKIKTSRKQKAVRSGTRHVKRQSRRKDQTSKGRYLKDRKSVV